MLQQRLTAAHGVPCMLCQCRVKVLGSELVPMAVEASACITVLSVSTTNAKASV